MPQTTVNTPDTRPETVLQELHKNLNEGINGSVGQTIHHMWV